MGYLCAMSTLYGIDFTSSPSSRKPVTVACGHVADDGVLILESIERLPAWSAFEAFLMRPGPWLGAFDFPFGLPRESVLEHGWPTDWAGMVRAVSLLSRNEFKALADAERAPRAVGQKYTHRATDRPAGSHSPMKFVNPPVGWMFQEGARRLLEAGVHLPGMHGGDGSRVALEAYPGWLARSIVPASYKSESATGQTPARLSVSTADWTLNEEGAAVFSGALAPGSTVSASASQGTSKASTASGSAPTSRRAAASKGLATPSWLTMRMPTDMARHYQSAWGD
mgnify:CR=1 FL=1